MVKRRVRRACRNCRLIVEKGGTCPICGSADLTVKWYGMLFVIKPKESKVAKELNIERKGVYAIWIL